MKISITTSELNEMINLVLKPERMNSMFDLTLMCEILPSSKVGDG